MDNFPSIFPYTCSTATPPHLSLNTMMDHMNSQSYIKFPDYKQNDNDDHDYLGLMANNGSVSSPPDQDVERVVSRSSSLVSSETSTGDHHFAKTGMINKDRKMKKPRYAFQTRSQVDILDDGYRWRKYGQKAVKNNKFPRSYYRCTYQGCNVKKQVQRLSKDEQVVVTTYEGMHSHPIEKSTDNFEHILTQMKIYTSS